MSSPYRTPAPPPVDLARRVGWLERIWTRARRRLVVWWRRPERPGGDEFVPGRKVVIALRERARRNRALSDAGAHLLRSAEYNRQIRDYERAQKRPPPPPEPFRDPRPVDE